MVLYLWLRLDELPYDGIVSGGHRVEDPVNPLQRLLVLHVHSVVTQETSVIKKIKIGSTENSVADSQLADADLIFYF
jgi:hypothetical protein